VRRHVILAAAMGAMLVAAAPAEMAVPPAGSTVTMEDDFPDDDDFELPIFDDPTREDCLRGGWMDYPFRNQGECMRFANQSMRLDRP